ncbi:MAG: N-acetylmuramoyl-L-alanine amidase [Bacteroidetes bacterium]|nr:N-acetylmuramoyl-L-alanine amidase [Bacteroidota bacterium]
MRNIKFIVVHCTATPPSATLEAIKKFWKEERGWGDTPGYHYIIKRSGEIVKLLAEAQKSYGAYGHNAECIHIAYIGGVDKDNNPIDNRTDAQKESMFQKLFQLSQKYPQAKILGHRDFPEVKKACPSFDVREWLKNYVPDVLTKQNDEGEEEQNLAA